MRAHGVKECDEVVDFRLLRRGRDDGGALRQYGGEDRVLGAHHGDLREGDRCPLEATVALRKVVAVAVINLGAEGAHSVNMKVHRATANAIAAWVANDHATEPGKEWTKEHEAGAHLCCRFKWNEEPFGVRRLQAHRFGGWSLNGDADVAEGIGEHIDVEDPWNVLEVHPVAG